MTALPPESENNPPECTRPEPPPLDEQPLIYQSRQLMDGRREVWIEHGRDMYRLRLTQQNKLILTK